MSEKRIDKYSFLNLIDVEQRNTTMIQFNRLLLTPLLVVALMNQYAFAGDANPNRSIVIKGGQVIKLPFDEQGLFQTETSEVTVLPPILDLKIDKEDPESEDLAFLFVLRAKSKAKIEKFSIEEVSTENSLEPLMHVASSPDSYGKYHVNSPYVKVDAKEFPWLYTGKASIFLFKFTVSVEGRPDAILYQSLEVSLGNKNKIIERADKSFKQAQLLETKKVFEVPVCTSEQRYEYRPDEKEMEAHRQFMLPVIGYPFDTKPFGRWNFTFRGIVDKLGKVTCYYSSKDQSLNEQRRNAIRQIAASGYTPFLKDGRPVSTFVSQYVREEELPQELSAPPSVPLETVIISMSRSSCYGSCPDYKVVVYGNGRVVFEGFEYVDAIGKHEYTIPPQNVAHLVELVAKSGIWSSREDYSANITDVPTLTIAINLNGAIHKIKDYGGWEVGIPVAVYDFAREIDKMANTAALIHSQSQPK